MSEQEQQSNTSPRQSYKYLVVSALPSEMQAFYAINSAFNNKIPLDRELNVYQTIIENENWKQTILTFTSAAMGMPHNSASIMQVIERHDPMYILFIGTCASLKNKTKMGSVVVPKSVFNYELGKSTDLGFASDHRSHDMSKQILEHAESICSIDPKPDWLTFDVITDDDFSSGSVVVDSFLKKLRISIRASRKTNGLDMEAYSLGVIQHLQPLKTVGVIKGVMDLGFEKSDEDKSKAMTNSARFAYELICHIENEDFLALARLNKEK